jgi:hypothetical protein
MSVSNSTPNQCQVLPAAPSSSPTPTPGGTNNTGTGSQPSGAVNSPSPNPTEICVSMAVIVSSVHAGQTAQYSILVSPQGGRADDVTVQISLPAGQTTSPLGNPVFNVCGNGDGTTVCSLRTMNVGQSTQLEAEVPVPSNASTGGTVTLAAKVTAAAPGATSTGSVIDSASVSVAKNPTTPPSGGHTGGHGSGSHQSGGSGSSGTGGSTGSGNGAGGTTANRQPFTNLPPLLGTGTSAGSTSRGNSSSLFPTIAPSTGSTSGGQGTLAGKDGRKPYKATTTADILPLNTGQISGQIAGLIVLGLGILLVFARITLRKPRSSDAKE